MLLTISYDGMKTAFSRLTPHQNDELMTVK